MTTVITDLMLVSSMFRKVSEWLSDGRLGERDEDGGIFVHWVTRMTHSPTFSMCIFEFSYIPLHI